MVFTTHRLIIGKVPKSSKWGSKYEADAYYIGSRFSWEYKREYSSSSEPWDVKEVENLVMKAYDGREYEFKRDEISRIVYEPPGFVRSGRLTFKTSKGDIQVSIRTGLTPETLWADRVLLCCLWDFAPDKISSPDGQRLAFVTLTTDKQGQPWEFDLEPRPTARAGSRNLGRRRVLWKLGAFLGAVGALVFVSAILIMVVVDFLDLLTPAPLTPLIEGPIAVFTPVAAGLILGPILFGVGLVLHLKSKRRYKRRGTK